MTSPEQKRPRAHLTVPMIVRMRDLAEAGLGCEAIAAVIDLDYGQRPSRYTVARYVGRTKGLGLRTVHKGSFGVTRDPNDPANSSIGSERRHTRIASKC